MIIQVEPLGRPLDSFSTWARLDQPSCVNSAVRPKIKAGPPHTSVSVPTPPFRTGFTLFKAVDYDVASAPCVNNQNDINDYQDIHYQPRKPLSKSCPASPMVPRATSSTSPSSPETVISLSLLPCVSSIKPSQNLGRYQTHVGSDGYGRRYTYPLPMTHASLRQTGRKFPRPSPIRGSQRKSANTDAGMVTSSSCKRGRAVHDVDGPGTAHLACKKRRLRRDLVTSRLSLPHSLPASHILNRELGDDKPVLARFSKYATMGAKKAGHQTSLIRKAAIMNRLRLNARQAAINRGDDKLLKMTETESMSHGLQVVTTSTGAMFPGRMSSEQTMPMAWRSHTKTEGHNSHSATPALSVGRDSSSTASSSSSLSSECPGPPSASGLQAPCSSDGSIVAGPGTSIMTPMDPEQTVDDDMSAFPEPQHYGEESSDDEMDGVYADFGVLFRDDGIGSGEATRDSSDPSQRRDDHFYEEYFDELDGISWTS